MRPMKLLRHNRAVQGRRHAKRGISLLEVVTCGASLAVLSTLLLPTLGEARRQGKEIRCLANLGRIAHAGIIYAAADSTEFAIPAHSLIGSGSMGNYAWGGKSGVGEPVGDTSQLSSKWGTVEGRGPATRPLNRILYGDVFPDHQFNPGSFGVNWLNDTQLDLDIYRCPADYGYSGHHYSAWRNSKLTSFDHYGNSYTACTSWIGIPGAGCMLLSNSSLLRPVSRVPVPSRTVLFLENCGRFGYRANYGGPNDGGCDTMSGNSGADVETNIRGWHGRMWMFQTAFVDGHAGTVRMEGHQQPEPSLGRYPGCDVDNLEQCQRYWRCVIFRGPGWQLDTLPAPPVQTDIPCAQGGGVVNPIE